MTISAIKHLYQTKLQELYPPNEISAILNLLAEDCSITSAECSTNPNKELVSADEQFLLQSLERLQCNEPVQYIRTKADFYGLEFEVSPAVLIPRQETELLVYRLIKQLQFLENPTIVDACTGSGCIAIALKKHLPQATVYACDISTAALEIANRNAERNNADVTFIHCDILQPQASEQLPPCSVLVSNPPYVMQSEKAAMHANVLNFEPDLALFVSNENPLLFYDALAQLGLQLLQPHGLLVCEINENLGVETQQLFKDSGYSQVEILHDLHEKQRFVHCVLR
ncbi:MAG: peptide chain release factor N(5)-glutamine methyltransferase [Bacteroidales bacterium]|jgi:release factor glutamine methyltransferase|nr:peptide chain release factor N(5)-glutamine methyltransferase [Bacteroidales bacterium]